MFETDWKEILNYSQKELKDVDKEKLCDNLSWMEPDDIELNFTDLKTLFRLAQDILKYKSEQVNNLNGQLETVKRIPVDKKNNVKSDATVEDSDTDTVSNKEEEILANKEILEQLHLDIAELEQRKDELTKKVNMDSDSSRDIVSEIETIDHLEKEVLKKNKHIRKLLIDMKVLEEDNTTLKQKLSIFKLKLNEATLLIENLTEQLNVMNKECSELKGNLGKAEESKSRLQLEIKNVNKRLHGDSPNKETNTKETSLKLQNFKDTIKRLKKKLDVLATENDKLKNDLQKTPESVSTVTVLENKKDLKIKELQEKLTESSHKILESANLINILKIDNDQLKNNIDDAHGNSTSETLNISDDSKERNMIIKLQGHNRKLAFALKEAEGTIFLRENELVELTSQLKHLQSEDRINVLLHGLKNKKRQIKFKDEGIKSLVEELNTIHELVNSLQLENETLRRQLKIPFNEKLHTTGILREYTVLKKRNFHLKNKLEHLDRQLVSVKFENHIKTQNILKLINALKEVRVGEDKINAILNDENIEISDNISYCLKNVSAERDRLNDKNNEGYTIDYESIVEENEGLRNSLAELLSFLKDNSTTTSGVLTLECPSLDHVLQSMEARRAAGWMAPHMKTILELRAAMGGRDALLAALNDSRMETYKVMEQLSNESQKCIDLEKELIDVKTNMKTIEDIETGSFDYSEGECGSWILEPQAKNIDILDNQQLQSFFSKTEMLYKNRVRNNFIYFKNKFSALNERLSSLILRTTEDKNHWAVQEERYKDEIETLKTQLHEVCEDDVSIKSPGLIQDTAFNLQSRCDYLQENYNQIRILNKNIKNEYLQFREETLEMASQYENQIQNSIFEVTELISKLCNSVPIEIFWKQNLALNDYILKYRNLLQRETRPDLTSKHSINCKVKSTVNGNDSLSSINLVNLQEKETIMITELEDKKHEIQQLSIKITELQQSQAALIKNVIFVMSDEEINIMKENLSILKEENKILKESNRHLNSQLDIVTTKLQGVTQNDISQELEINVLRHQVLDLQSANESKSTISRLSNELLVTHLQVTESFEKIQTLKLALNKETKQRLDAEKMLRNQKNVLYVYNARNNAKFKNLQSILDVLQEQYQGVLPLWSIENYVNTISEIHEKQTNVNEKLNDIDYLRENLITKHSVYDQIIHLSKSKCLGDYCDHKIKCTLLENMKEMELGHLNKKFESVEDSRRILLDKCRYLEKTLLLLNLDSADMKKILPKNNEILQAIDKDNINKLDDASDSHSIENDGDTYTISKDNEKIKYKVISTQTSQSVQKTDSVLETKNTYTQTDLDNDIKEKVTLPDETQIIEDLKKNLENLTNCKEYQNKELYEIKNAYEEKSREVICLNQLINDLNEELIELRDETETFIKSQDEKDQQIALLNKNNIFLKEQLDEYCIKNDKQVNIETQTFKENKSLLMSIKKLEEDKNNIVENYTKLLKSEREDYEKSIRHFQAKLQALTSQLDEQGTSFQYSAEGNECVAKYSLKVAELEEKCFKLNSELESTKSEVKSFKCESERWKTLASERLTKMEQLSEQLKERHGQEVDSYKAENQHWLTQLNETQREHYDLRVKLAEQKAEHIKQLSNKDAHIEHLRSIINNLKIQITNMQSMMSINDPSFDLSAIVEVDEASDGISQQDSDKLELKFLSTEDLNDSPDLRTSTAIWQEPVLERLRREKQLISKQNSLLRRQIKALAGRERRARLDAQNLKNQVFRISTSGIKVASAESVALQNKIASLQAQLTSARRDAHSTVALWDKWKRAAQSSERWQAKYEEKCQELIKIESSLNLAKSAVSRLEKEKRVMLSRLSEPKSDRNVSIEKQESELPEKSTDYYDTSPPIPTRALLERVEAQQRRIVALEMADRGNEPLVSEYEKSLAEITSLKGQVLKLESTLLEAQIKSPLRSTQDPKPELDYWRSYCDMLKEENMQLTLRVNCLEGTTSTSPVHHQRVIDLEQTVLTLRGLVSKLQADQKSTSAVLRRPDSRPASGRSSATEKSRPYVETYRTEIANLKRSIQEKDLLLEKSKEMLKIAAEREDDLLKENMLLRQRLEELTEHNGGFLSV